MMYADASLLSDPDDFPSAAPRGAFSSATVGRVTRWPSMTPGTCSRKRELALGVGRGFWIA
jgi:hypothetical protein